MNFFAAPAILSAGYHAFALIAAIRKLREPVPLGRFAPPVSILKPVRGCDSHFAGAIASHALLDYPEYEILFGVASPDDPAIAQIELLQRNYPNVSIRLIVKPNDAPNSKVGSLEHLAAAARHPILLVNDSDIVVERSYLHEVVAPLADDSCGLVTCLYRGSGGSTAARFEALGVATEFAPSVLVAREVGVNEFAMGSTLAFRASDLERIGGFASIRKYLADDYQLGKRLTGLGLRVILGRPVVETWLGSGKWRDIWMHQLRWSRTIRVSRASGYYGYAITHTVWWCLLAAFAGNWTATLACYATRMVCGELIAALVMRDRDSLARWWWMPARDLFGFAVWIAGLSGNTVEWGGTRFVIQKDGSMRP